MSTPSLLILDDREGLIARSPGVERLRKHADVRVLRDSFGELSDAELTKVQILMAVRERTALDAVVLAKLPSLQLILQTGGHAYHLDGQYATEHGIPVTLMRRAFGPKAAVPELTFALAVSALRMIPAAHQSVVNGEWQPITGRTLNGRKLGILGYGRHGKNVARIAKAYGMDVVVWQRDAQSAPLDGVATASLDELLASSDVVTVHLKLSDESRGLLDAERLARMKPGSVLINTSRGAIIDEAALVDALQSGPLSAAGLDVFAQEPLPVGSELCTLSNVVMTPHIGWTVEEVFTEFADIAADQLEAYLAGTLDRTELLNPDVVLPDQAIGGLSHGSGQ